MKFISNLDLVNAGSSAKAMIVNHNREKWCSNVVSSSKKNLVCLLYN